MVRSELYKECVRQLDGSLIEDSGFDAMCIFQDVLGEKNPMFKPLENVSAENEAKIRELSAKRCGGEPLQYILGEWEFWGLPIKVGEGVLIPRPDTETLVEDVLKIARKSDKDLKIADLCSGSGCIAISLKKELPGAEIYALELSEKALKYLKANAELNNVEIHIIKADILSETAAGGLPGLDIIVSNPPYLTLKDTQELQQEVSHEPPEALYGGTDGLNYYRKMTPLWKKYLKKDGWLCYEFGMGQHDDVGSILAENGFGEIKFSRDAGGIIRTVSAKKTEEK